MSDNKALGENFLRKHEADLRNFLYRATRYLYGAEGEKERDRENGSELSSYDEETGRRRYSEWGRIRSQYCWW